MQLNIDELDDNQFDDNLFDDNQYEDNKYDESLTQVGLEKIPENFAPIKVIKKSVHFTESERPTHQSIPKQHAKMVRPKIPSQKPKISYEDILSKMGMFVSNGKLHLVDRNTLSPQVKNELLSIQKNTYQDPYQQQEYKEQQPNATNIIPKNSYIYNKYFKEELQTPTNNIRKPTSINEYKTMVINNLMEKQRIKLLKSRKLVMPTSNIHMGGNSANLNILFGISKR